jgi:hypothetical protein
VRFDVVGILLSEGTTPRLVHVPDAF